MAAVSNGDNGGGGDRDAAASAPAAPRPVAVERGGHAALARFGLIADTQYADAEDAPNYVGNRVRRYRQSLNTLCSAVLRWNALPLRGERPLDVSALWPQVVANRMDRRTDGRTDGLMDGWTEGWV